MREGILGCMFTSRGDRGMRDDISQLKRLLKSLNDIPIK